MTIVGISSNTRNVSINVEVPSDLLDLDKKFTAKLPGLMRRIAMEGKSFWKTVAGQKLKSSRKQYQDGIDFEITDNISFNLVLTGFLATSVEFGNKAFDMKPGFLKTAVNSPFKRKFPRAIAESLAAKSTVQKYKIIPLNVNRYVNMQKPRVFRTVTDAQGSSMWQHPGWKGANLAETVATELVDEIIPKHIATFLQEVL